MSQAIENQLILYCVEMIQKYHKSEYSHHEAHERAELVIFYLELLNKLQKSNIEGDGSDIEILELIYKNEELGHSVRFNNLYKEWVKENFVEANDVNTENIKIIEF